MTTPKNAPAAKSTTPAAKKAAPAAPAFDFSKMNVVEDEAPRRAGATAVDPSKNPFLPALRASMEKRESGRDGAWIGAGKAVTLPNAEAAKGAVYLLRQAGNHLGIGVAVREEKLSNGQYKVRFAAKSRKQRKSKTA